MGLGLLLCGSPSDVNLLWLFLELFLYGLRCLSRRTARKIQRSNPLPTPFFPSPFTFVFSIQEQPTWPI
jgi:hypothetical protein